MTPNVKTILMVVAAFLALRAIEQIAANFGMDWTSVLPRPGVSSAGVPTAAGDSAP